MATVKIFPTSTVSNAWVIQGGDGTVHGVLSDGAASSIIKTNAQNIACIVELDDYTAGGTISNIRFIVKGFKLNTRSGDTDIQVIITDSSNSALYTETVTLNFNSYNEETHLGTVRTTSDGSAAWTDADLDGLRLNINTSPEDPNGVSFAVVTFATVVVTYEASSGPANITSLNSIAKANITSVNTISLSNITSINTIA